MPKHTPVWRGSVSASGKLTLHQRAAFAAWLKHLKGAKVDVRVQRASSKRSVDQNAWLWRAETLLAAEIGYDAHEVDRLHYELLGKRFGTYDGDGVRLPKRTSSSLSAAEMSEYFEWLVRFAAEFFGVLLELPNDPPQETT